VCGNTIRYANLAIPDLQEHPGITEPHGEEAVRKGKERAWNYAKINSVARYLDLFRRSIHENA
jgi:hypothetical protein